MEAKELSASDPLDKDAFVATHDVVTDDDLNTSPETGEVLEAEPEDELDDLDPLTEPRQWVIGKPPELGGNEKTYSIYTQDVLGYMPRMRFFALVTGTIAKAMKAGASLDIPGLDLRDGLSMRERAEMLTSGSLDSAGDFFQLALQLASYSPDFLLRCYAIWLSVPREEIGWFMQVADQKWDPKNDRWGIKDEDGLLMIETFIDQNYEDIRRFFAEHLPRLMRRGQAQEKKFQARESASVPSKQ